MRKKNDFVKSNKIFITILLLMFFSFFFIFTLSAQNNNEDRVINFSSTVFINLDKSIKVIEEIEILTNNEIIKHGIERFLPIVLINSDQTLQFLSISIEEILLDDSKVNFSTSFLGSFS